jgi:tetratricopeptide (TPR) repeat protein
MEANLSGESAGVAFWAHIGGFLFGAAAAAAVRFGHVEERFINPKIEKELGIARPFGLARGMEARAAGRFRQARFYLDQALREAPADPEVHYELFQTYNALGDRSAAARHALKHVALETKANRMDSALATFREASEHMPTLIWPAALLLALGRHAERTHDNTLALWLYQELLKRHPGDPLAARALAFTASIHQRHGDVRSAVASLARALAVPKLDPTIRLDLENRIRELCTAAGLPLPEMPPVVASSAVAAPPVHGG